jgi:hypothetical protein
MRRLRSFGAFWWDFVVGEDPWLAVGIVLGLAATALAYRLDIPAWWVLPVVVVALLSWSVTRAAAREPVAPEAAEPPDEDA